MRCTKQNVTKALRKELGYDPRYENIVKDVLDELWWGYETYSKLELLIKPMSEYNSRDFYPGAEHGLVVFGVLPKFDESDKAVLYFDYKEIEKAKGC